MSPEEPLLNRDPVSGVIQQSRIILDRGEHQSFESRRMSQPGAIHVNGNLGIQEGICFICLDGTEDLSSPDIRLVSCCSQCYAVTHIRCWKEWRLSQAAHARRVRVAGNRIGTDPFLCSICKSGAARLRGEWVSLRWLHSFANFGDDRGPRVRFASGLFAALTGAREENPTRPQDDEETDDDFLDYIENQPDSERVSFFCGHTKKFLLIVFALASGISGSIVALNQLNVVETSFLLMVSVTIILAFVGAVTSYVLVRYNRLLNSRSIT